MKLKFLTLFLTLFVITPAMGKTIEESYIFRIYYCGQPAFLMWAEPEVAGSLNASGMKTVSPEVAELLDELSSRATEDGNAIEVYAKGPQCPGYEP